MRKLYKTLVLCSIMGAIYCIIELFWRGFTHFSMFFVGGACGFCIGLINEIFSFEMPMIYQCSVATVIVTGIEFVSGCILNLWMKLNVWDYSALPGNVLGQICPQFALAWFAISAFAIVLDDYLRYWIFNEEKPHYKII